MQNPSPKLKARMAVCLVIPSRSASGIMIGITTEAWPEPEVINTLIMVLAMSIPIPWR